MWYDIHGRLVTFDGACAMSRLKHPHAVGDGGICDLPDDRWPTIHINSWPEWAKYVERVYAPPDGSHRFVFRGQPSAGKTSLNLRPTLLRLACDRGIAESSSTVAALESHATVDFICDAHLHRTFQGISDSILSVNSEPVPEASARIQELEHPLKLVSYWSMMQHHGAPTRLLDWTLSPYVALYFACNACLADDGAVWTVCQYAVNDRRRQLFGNDASDELAFPGDGSVVPPRCPKLHFLLPPRQVYRSAAQQGWFSICDDVRADHASVLAKYMCEADGNHTNRGWHSRAIISRSLKIEALRRLRSMNVTGKSLFPDEIGLAKSAGEVFMCHRIGNSNETHPYHFTDRHAADLPRRIQIPLPDQQQD